MNLARGTHSRLRKRGTGLLGVQQHIRHGCAAKETLAGLLKRGEENWSRRDRHYREIMAKVDRDERCGGE